MSSDTVVATSTKSPTTKTPPKKPTPKKSPARRATKSNDVDKDGQPPAQTPATRSTRVAKKRPVPAKATSNNEETDDNNAAIQTRTPTKTAKRPRTKNLKKKSPTPDDTEESDADESVNRPVTTGTLEDNPPMGFSRDRAMLLPRVYMDVDLSTFDFMQPQPDSNPALTIWALGKAIQGCSTKGYNLLQASGWAGCLPARELKLRSKREAASLNIKQYGLNLASSQNCDAMLKQLYGSEAKEECERCTLKLGALEGCFVYLDKSDHAPITACGNCDWGRGGTNCLHGPQKSTKASKAIEDKKDKKSKKRKIEDVIDITDDDDDDDDIVEMTTMLLRRLDRSTCATLAK
ncbi:hypothetical protein TPAR_06737, partial [Tolypocladium paradoxum]